MTNDDDYTILDNFQSYVEKTELFKQFHWDAGNSTKQGNDVLYNGRIYHVNTFSGSDIGVTVEDIVTRICYSTNFGKQGLTRIITDQDRMIFDECTRLAENIRKKIIKQVAEVKINEFKIIDLTKEE